MRVYRTGRVMAAWAIVAAAWTPPHAVASDEGDTLDRPLAAVLRQNGFTGKIQSTLTDRLGRPLNARLIEVGRMLFFDTVGGLHNDNTCAGCHAPATGMGDSQSIAIGIGNNGVVGSARKGPRNQRRTPSVVNTAFFPSLMWNGRFSAPSGDPFNNSLGFLFPAPEGNTAFPPNDAVVRHLLIAQAHMPPTELNEAAGFTGTKGTISAKFDPFDDGLGGIVPLPDQSGSRNEPIRQKVLERLNALPAYRDLFGKVFPLVNTGTPIDFKMFAQAIAEFEFSLVRANAPIDRYARGDRDALSAAEKRGALLFFGKADCVACHAVARASNEMFSDFQNHNVGVPQLAPPFGPTSSNTLFDGPGADEDFGAEQNTGNAADRYKFRTSPLRNVALQPAFFHNGAFTRLEDAVRHHLDVFTSARQYSPPAAGVAPDLTGPVGPIEPVLQAIDPLVANPTRLREAEIQDLVRFVGEGLLDPQAKSANLCRLVPDALPSGNRPLVFEGCGGYRHRARERD